MSELIYNYVSRYVVPFYYDYENNGYGKIRKFFIDNEITTILDLGLPKDGKWVEIGFWENYKSDGKSQAEMDLYSYLPVIFLELSGDKADVRNLGSSFVYKTNGKLFDLEYKGEEKIIPFECKDLGLIILRNGIGFIWYEINFKTNLSSEDYVKFQHDFKELARTQSDKFVKKIGYDKEKKAGVYKSFVIGTWLSKLVSSNSLGIRFWAERNVAQDISESINIPDKALLFQYLFVDETTELETNNLIFRIANGYDKKYNAPKDMKDCLYKPFGNTSFYISKSGMACVVINENSNAVFFESQFREKYIRDYFFIYILLAYQSYSCAHYSRLLTKLPADENLFNKKSKYVDILESLNGQINLFLVKSVFESVSNVHHQNGLYRYGKNELSIEDDIQSLTIGLDALKDIEKEKRDRKVDKALTTFGFIVVISAWVDGLNLVDWFRNSNIFDTWHKIVSAFIGILTIYLIATLLWIRKK